MTKLNISIQAITDQEYQHLYKNSTIYYSYCSSPFGKLLISTIVGKICYISFVDKCHIGKSTSENELIKHFPYSKLKNLSFEKLYNGHNKEGKIEKHEIDKRSIDSKYERYGNEIPTNPASIANTHKNIIPQLFNKWDNTESQIKILLKGTKFQLKVWQELLNIPYGSTISYQELAKELDKTNATRAVANAVAANKIAYIIPCHRVIRKNSSLGGYKWGEDRKQQILNHEIYY